MLVKTGIKFGFRPGKENQENRKWIVNKSIRSIPFALSRLTCLLFRGYQTINIDEKRKQSMKERYQQTALCTRERKNHTEPSIKSH